MPIENDEKFEKVKAALKSGRWRDDPELEASVLAEAQAYKAQRQTIQEPEEQGFLSRVGDDLSSRVENIRQAGIREASGEQSKLETALQTSGQTILGGFDILGEGLVSAGRAVSPLIPDDIEEGVKGAVSGATTAAIKGAIPNQFFVNRSTGETATDADFMRGIEKIRAANPRATANVDAAAALVFAALPVKTRPDKLTSAGKAAEKLETSAKESLKRRRDKHLEGVVKPKRTMTVKKEEALRTEVGGLPLKKFKVKLTDEQIAAKNEVSKIPEVKRGNTAQEDLNIIRKEAFDEAKSLKSQVAKNDAAITRIEAQKSVSDGILKAREQVLLTGDAGKTAQDLAQKAMTLIKRHPPTASGLLQARKDLYRFVEDQKGAAFFEGKKSPGNVAVDSIAQAMNTLIAEKAPSVAVRQSLRKQSLLFDTVKTLAPKAGDELNNILLRAWHKSLAILPVRGEFNQLMAAAFGVGGLGASAKFAPIFTAMLGASAAGAGTGFALASPTARKAYAKVFKAMDKVIANTSDGDIIRAIRADRAALMEFMKAQEVPEEETKGLE